MVDKEITLADKAKIVDISKETKRSSSWYQELMRDGMAQRTANVGITGQQILSHNQNLQSNRILPGQIICFGYDAKFKDSLEYYDTFPLVLPWRVDGDHFWGLNLHYIHPMYRLAILDKLLSIRNNKVVPENKRIKLSWSIINALGTSTKFKHCVKQYLHGYVKTKFIVIPPGEDYAAWFRILFLPVERFKTQKDGKNSVVAASRVWRDA